MPAASSHKVRYTEGDWFAVPLRDGGFAAGVVARSAPGGRVLLGYFFGPRRESLPVVQELRERGPEEAVLVARFGDLSLIDGSWPIIGRRDEWNRDLWPMPEFARRDAVSGMAQSIRYDSNDPTREIAASTTQHERAENLPQDGLLGAGVVEIKLTRLLPKL